MESSEPPNRYVPAAGRKGLSALYDPAMALTMRENAWRPDVIAAVLSDPQPNDVVDVGAGTGTFVAALAERAPRAKISGIDGDPAILARAALKVAGYGDRVELREGLAQHLPLADNSVDAVVMTLVLHHLDTVTKRAALTEARRVLRPGRRIVVADWGKPADRFSRGLFFLLQLLDGFDTTRAHAAGEIPDTIESCGFDDVQRAGRWRTAWGTLELLTGTSH